MSRGILPSAATIFACAITRLREELGRREGHKISQDKMARRIGCSHAGYRKWEDGTSIPRGDWLMKILELCPGPEYREQFLLDISGKGSTIPSSPESAEPKREKHGEPRPLVADSVRLAARLHDPKLAEERLRLRIAAQKAAPPMSDAKERLRLRTGTKAPSEHPTKVPLP